MRHLAFAAVLALPLTSGPLLAAPALAPGFAREAPLLVREKKEPTAGQMAARERQRKCGVEWREAKKGGATGGLKWPQYWSKCNARLKGNQA